METTKDNAYKFLGDFIAENKKSGKLSPQTAEDLKKLWDQYKLDELENDSAIITADFGELGSIQIRYVKAFDRPMKFKYEEGSYDYVSITTKRHQQILWTDYENIEPYNRHSGLYCDGASFKHLGYPVKQKPEYREFNTEYNHTSHISFAVWGFQFNNFYGSVCFGICIKKENVEPFIAEARKIIGK